MNSQAKTHQELPGFLDLSARTQFCTKRLDFPGCWAASLTVPKMREYHVLSFVVSQKGSSSQLSHHTFHLSSVTQQDGQLDYSGSLPLHLKPWWGQARAKSHVCGLSRKHMSHTGADWGPFMEERKHWKVSSGGVMGFGLGCQERMWSKVYSSHEKINAMTEKYSIHK